MTALNKQARLVSSARISEIANGANLIMGEKEWLANTAIYLANELKTATKAFQSTGFSLLEAEEKLEAAKLRIAELTESHSKLRDTMAGIHNTIRMDGGYTPLAAILNAAKRAYEESATAAGIGVKGE